MYHYHHHYHRFIICRVFIIIIFNKKEMKIEEKLNNGLSLYLHLLLVILPNTPNSISFLKKRKWRNIRFFKFFCLSLIIFKIFLFSIENLIIACFVFNFNRLNVSLYFHQMMRIVKYNNV